MKKRILIVGQKISTLVNYLDSHDFDYIVLKDIKRTKFPDRKFKRRVLCDFSDRKSVLATVDNINKSIDGVIATYETYILPAAWIAEHLGLPGIPVQSAEACTDKFLMRQMFARAKEKISPDYSVVRSEEDIVNFASTHKFPLIIKPANLSKSLLVTKNHTLNELIRNYRKTIDIIDDIYLKFAPDRAPKLLIEEFMEGSIHSVDAFVDRNGIPRILDQVVDYQTGYDVGYDDNFHYSRVIPSCLSTENLDALRRCAEIGVRALGMKNSPAHIEVIMTKDGPRIVEIGARNGGYRERMHGLANGIDITGAALSLALGTKPDINTIKEDACAVLELFPHSNGTFQGVTNEAMLRSLPSVKFFSIKAHIGETVGKSSDGFKTPLIIILHAADSDALKRDLDIIRNKAKIVTGTITQPN